MRDQNLLCRNNCKFYGSPQYDGYCSKCKDLVGGSSPRPKTSLTGSQTLGGSRISSGEEKDTARNKLYTLIENKLIPAAAAQIRNRVEAFFKELRSSRFSCVDSLAQTVTQFYETIEALPTSSHHFRDTPARTMDELVDCLEAYITNRIYVSVFDCCENDLQISLSFQKLLSRYHWISAEHLGLSALLENSDPASKIGMAWSEALNEMLRVDIVRAPLSKLACVVSACKTLFTVAALVKITSASNHQECEPSDAEILREASKVGGDDLTPLVIFLVLKARPPLLHSNIEFIRRFSAKRRGEAGETGYYLTVLTVAVHAISQFSSDPLKFLSLQPEKFEALCSSSGQQLNQQDVTEANDQESEECHALNDSNRVLRGIEALTQTQNQLDAMISRHRTEMSAYRKQLDERSFQFEAKQAAISVNQLISHLNQESTENA